MERAVSAVVDIRQDGQVERSCNIGSALRVVQGESVDFKPARNIVRTAALKVHFGVEREQFAGILAAKSQSVHLHVLQVYGAIEAMPVSLSPVQSCLQLSIHVLCADLQGNVAVAHVCRQMQVGVFPSVDYQMG